MKVAVEMELNRLNDLLSAEAKLLKIFDLLIILRNNSDPRPNLPLFDFKSKIEDIIQGE